MRIKLKVHFAGNGFSAAPGDEIERPDDEAIRLIKKGYAVPMGAMPVETAILPAPEETRDAPIRKRPAFRKGKHG